MGHPKKRLVREIGGFVNTHFPTEKPQKCLAMGAIKYAEPGLLFGLRSGNAEHFECRVKASWNRCA
ncbi:hypothetical protein OICFNHDK_0005 [Methylobacterium bullatum]|uniref:Uncharacterized protein n=1 Tax=Methylobacterium bullatum TaxID=570505 RepID=A0A679JLI8_9HYPH|nr:hypothetical protein OICFNHDK_0005 [Methylobacterium bullatum]CAA2138394.1 hypothetical protein MBLL_01124 [Methylobacterium bullatum]